jgi:hypothetical protein
MTVGRMKPMCLHCKHLLSQQAELWAGGRCTAFPSGIPDVIWEELQFDHRFSYSGDNDITFEKEDGEKLLQRVYFKKFESIELLDLLLESVFAFYDRGRALGIIDPPLDIV